MKNLLSLALVGASLLVVSAAQAQEIRVKAEIPFDFVVGNRAYSAGAYEISPAMKDTSALLLEDESNAKRAVTLSNACESNGPATGTKMVFHRVGDTYFLYQIWIEGRSSGREFPKSKTETLLARNGDKSEDVIVAANLLH